MSDDRTRLATGLNASSKYRAEYRQIGVIMSKEMFEVIKAEALRSGTSMGEIIRQCIELVLK